MAITEDDSLALRVARLEERVALLEGGLAAKPAALPAADEAPDVVAPQARYPLAEQIARSVLYVGGAYLLRALTELGVLPQLAGMALAFVYAMILLRFDAPVGALIAGGLIWEATTRFHALSTTVAAALTIVVAVALLFRSARVAAVMAVVTLTGVAIGSGDFVAVAIAATIAGIIAFRTRRDPLATTILAVASDFFAIALVVMTAFDRTPHSHLIVELTLVAIAAAWLLGNPLQAAFAIAIGGIGASVFAFTTPQLVIVWAVAAIVAAKLAPRLSIVFAIATVAAALIGGAYFGALLLAVAYLLLPSDAVALRVATLSLTTIAAFASLQSVLELTPLHRSLILAGAAIVLALPRRNDTALVARIVLGIAALQILAEDTRAGATTMVAALAAYGVAMLIVARIRVAEAAVTAAPVKA